MFTFVPRTRTTTFQALFIPAVVLLVLVSLPTVCFSQSLIVKDFESKNLDGFNYGTAGNGNQPTVVSERSRSGRFAMKSYLNRLDSQTNNRTEVTLGTSKNRHNEFNKDYWVGFSIFLPEDYEESEAWEILAQWHAFPDFELGESWRSPPLALEIRDGNWHITRRWDAKVNSFPRGKREIDGVRKSPLQAIEQDKGKWVDWVFHIKWSWGPEGLLQVWKDSTLIIEHKGPNTYNDRLGPYFKMGIYSGWGNNKCCQAGAHERVVYHDELRIATGPGASYETVTPPLKPQQQQAKAHRHVRPSQPAFSVN